MEGDPRVDGRGAPLACLWSRTWKVGHQGKLRLPQGLQFREQQGDVNRH